MINFALPYVIIAIILLIISPKFINRSYLFAANFIYALLAIFFLVQIFSTYVMIWYYGILPETFAFLNRVLNYGILIHFSLLFLSSIPPLLFLFQKFRTSKKLLPFVIFSAFLGILDSYLYPEKIQAGWNTIVSPVFNQYFIFCATLLLLLGSAFLVKLKVLPEFKRNNHKDILDAID